MAKLPELILTAHVEDLKVADILEWLCRKAAEENRARAEGHRDHSLWWVDRRAQVLPEMIEELRKLRFDMDEREVT